MRKHPFLIFSAVITFLVAGLIIFIQSPSFARIFKRTVAQYIPKDIGIVGDFTDFSIKIFPPGVAINRPSMKFLKKNIAAVPEGATIQAERVELNFRLFQLFAGAVRINEVKVTRGEIKVALKEQKDPRDAQSEPKEAKDAKGPKSRRKRVDLSWDDLVRIQADGIVLEETRIDLTIGDSQKVVHLDSPKLSIERLNESTSYRVRAALRDLRATFLDDLMADPEHDSLLKDFQVEAVLSPSGVVIERLQAQIGGEIPNATPSGIPTRANDQVQGPVVVSGSGTIKGNILNPVGLEVESKASVSFRTEVARRLIKPSILKKVSALSNLDGDFNLTGTVKFAVDRLVESLRFDGRVNARDVRFGEWTADEVEAVGTVDGDHLNLAHAKIQSALQDRKGGFIPGSGGTIEIGAVKLPLRHATQVAIPIKLEKAHIHWLAAGVLPQIYLLDFRASGTIDANLRLSPSLQVAANLDLTVPGLVMDNQRFKKTKPLRKILDLKDLRIRGPVEIDEKGFKPLAVQVSGGKSTQLEVGGRVDFKAGYALTAHGALDMADIGKLAEVPIKGAGELAVTVRGPASHVLVDFEPDLEAVEFLDLDLGDLKGKITYDDGGKGDSALIFSGMQAERGSLRYDANGQIIFSETEAMDLKFKVSQGDISELMGVFSSITKDLGWLPRELRGPMTGDIRLSGGLDMKALVVDGTVMGNAWEYMGERFKSVRLTGGYEKGKYSIRDAAAVKRSGNFTGRISYDAESKVEWSLQSAGLSLSDIDMLARLDVPVRGSLEVKSGGAGKLGNVAAVSTFVVKDLRVRGVAYPPSELSWRSDKGLAHLVGKAMGGQGNLDLTYSSTPRTPGSISLDANGLDFSTILLLLNPTLIPDQHLVGSISGNMKLDFLSGEVEKGSGKINLTDYQLAKTGMSFSLVSPVSVPIQHGTFQMSDLALKGPENVAHFSLRGNQGLINGAVTGQLDLGIAEFLTPAISLVKGALDLNYTIGGRLQEPTLQGRATALGASAVITGIEAPFENISISSSLRQNTLTISRIDADLGGGRVFGNGTILFFADRVPEINLKGTIQGPRLKIFPFQYAKIRGNIAVEGKERPYLVSGAVIIDQALSRERIMGQTRSSGLKALQYTPPTIAGHEGAVSNFKLKVDVAAERGILIQNDLFDAEFKGHLTVVNTLETPRLLGTTDLVQGRMLFKDRVFQLQAASATFDSPTVINPLVNMSAVTDVAGTRIQLYASGRMETLKVDLSSTPVLPEPEILSLLTLGMTSSQAQRLSAQDRSAMEQGEAANLLLNSLDFNRDIQSKTGLQIQLDQSINSQAGNSAFRPQTQTDTAAAPKIVIKRQIGKKLDLSYGSTVGVGSNTQRQVNAEYQVTPAFSVIGVWDSFQSQAAGRADDNQYSFGLDLKLQKRFK